MKVIKITAVWCSACIIMNKIWKEIEQEKAIETESYDIDFDEDEVKKYNPGDILPIFIFIKDDKEIKRIVGEHKKEEILKIIEELGD